MSECPKNKVHKRCHILLTSGDTLVPNCCEKLNSYLKNTERFISYFNKVHKLLQCSNSSLKFCLVNSKLQSCVQAVNVGNLINSPSRKAPSIRDPAHRHSHSVCTVTGANTAWSQPNALHPLSRDKAQEKNKI